MKRGRRPRRGKTDREEMRLGLPPYIAWRYLRARNAHSAVKAISVVAVCGVAVATAAIVCVLSVFNGFRDILSEKHSLLAPDVTVTPAKGKTFTDADSLAALIGAVDGVGAVSPSVTDNALALYGTREMPVTLKGVVPAEFRRHTAIESIMRDGTRFMESAESDSVAVSIGVAARLGIGGAGEGLLLFAPRRIGRVNLSNPVASFITDSVTTAGVYAAEQSDYDENMIICDIGTARTLFQYDAEATSLDVTARPGTDAASLAGRIAARLGPSVVVKDRLKQQEVNFRMVSIEKWVTFLLLFFILVIASFNIISTLCMAVIEKQRSIRTLTALGMTRRGIGEVFGWQSVFVALTGGAAGLALGSGLCLLQERFGFIKLAADTSGFIMQAYPVRLAPADLLLTLIPVAAVAAASAVISAAFARSRARVSAET